MFHRKPVQESLVSSVLHLWGNKSLVDRFLPSSRVTRLTCSFSTLIQSSETCKNCNEICTEFWSGIRLVNINVRMMSSLCETITWFLWMATFYSPPPKKKENVPSPNQLDPCPARSGAQTDRSLIHDEDLGLLQRWLTATSFINFYRH